MFTQVIILVCHVWYPASRIPYWPSCCVKFKKRINRKKIRLDIYRQLNIKVKYWDLKFGAKCRKPEVKNNSDGNLILNLNLCLNLKLNRIKPGGKSKKRISREKS